LFIADPGDGKWEEVNFQPADSPGGENYGWPIMEGPHCFSGRVCSSEGYVPPVGDYYRGIDCAIVGGAAQKHTFIYGDYCSGRIWQLARENDGWQTRLLTDAPFLISAIGQDRLGNVYVLDFGGGTVYRLMDDLDVRQ
jgi:hypothetical protein